MVKGERRIMHYSNKQMILLVGEGDFSFSSSLATAFGSASNIVATSYLSQSMVGVNHWSSEAHLEYLERKGCLLLYDIDVYNMNKNRTLKYYSFDVIVFNFPHAGHFDYLCEWDSQLIQMHKKLVEAYFRSASKMLNDGGEVHLTHRDDIPYNTWKVEKLAAKCGLHLKEKAPFCKEDYPGYHNKRGGGIESNKTFPIRSAFTFKFILKLSKKSCQNDLDFLPTLRPKAAVDQIPNSQTKMHKTAQARFSDCPSTSNDLLKRSPSLLADRNAYASSKVSEDSESSGLGFDLKADFRTTNDKVSGTFNGVSKGVRDIPGNLQSASSSVPTGRSLVTFGALLAVGIFPVFIAFTVFLMVLVPQKFAICFSIGCALLIASFFALKGPENQLAHMSLKERLPFTLVIIGSMVGTIYVSMVLLISWNAFPVSNGLYDYLLLYSIIYLGLNLCID